jgi:hypothetical protein
MRALVQGKRARFYFGAGNTVTRLSRQEIISLTRLAEQRYLTEKSGANPSLGSTIVNIFTVKGLLLAATGALIAYALPFSNNWPILGGALLGIIAPYPISVVYFFFCSHLHEYKFRSEFVRQFIEDEQFHHKIAGELDQHSSKAKFLASIDSFWYRFSLRFPVSAGLAAFALGRGQIIFWAFVITSAVLPFLGVIKIASTSIFEPMLSFFASLSWVWGFQHTLEAMKIFVAWNLPHTVSDFITLAIMAYALGILYIAYRGERFGLIALPSVVISFLLAPIIPLLALPIFPFLWILSLGRLKYENFSAIEEPSFSGFWGGFLHFWIIGAVMGALLQTGQLFIQHG